MSAGFAQEEELVLKIRGKQVAGSIHVVKTATRATRDIAFAIRFTPGDQPSGC